MSNPAQIRSWTNRQGNMVTVHRRADGSLEVEVSGTGSHRAFQAQLRAARKRATVLGV